MGIFNRAPREPRQHTTKTRSPREPYTMERRPRFGQWLKIIWLDLVTMAAMGAIGLGVCFHSLFHSLFGS